MCQMIHICDLPDEVADAVLAEVGEFDIFPFEPDELGEFELEPGIKRVAVSEYRCKSHDVWLQTDLSEKRPTEAPAQAV